MVSILKGGGLALALILLIVISSSFQTISVAHARIPARQLAKNCDSPIQGEVAGCGGGGSSKPVKTKKPIRAPGSSRCRKGCCGTNKMGECDTCC